MVGAFALALGAYSRRRGPALWLAVFLAMICGNLAADLARFLHVDPAEKTFWFRVATAFAVADPVLLYAFGLALAPPARGEERAEAVLVVGGALVLAPSTLLIVQPERIFAGLTPPFMLALAAYTCVVYALVFRRALRAALRGPSSRGSAYLLAALAIAALPVVARVVDSIASNLMRFRDDPLLAPTGALVIVPFLVGLLVVAVAAFAMARAARSAPADIRRAVVLGAAAGFGLSALLRLSFLVPDVGLFAANAEVVFTLGRSATPIRWLLVGALASVAVAREDALMLDETARRKFARTLLAAVFLLAAGLLVPVLQSALPFARDARPFEWVVLAAALGASQGFRRLVDATAQRVYALPPTASDGGPLVEPLLEGRLVAGRYRLVRFLGRGGGGRVFLARDEIIGRDVALKEVPDEEVGLREAKAAGSVSHPHVLGVHDVHRRGGAAVLVCEHADGGTLAERIATHGRLPLAEGLALVEAVLEGLAAVHERGVVHCDLKPSNVLFVRGVAKIADFGLARGQAERTRHVDEPEGTPAFRAPEQERGERPTPATDVFGVGRLARASLPEGLPGEVERVVARALAPDPASRYPSAGAMLSAWQAARSAAPIEQVRPADA